MLLSLSENGIHSTQAERMMDSEATPERRPERLKKREDTGMAWGQSAECRDREQGVGGREPHKDTRRFQLEEQMQKHRLRGGTAFQGPE